MSVRAQPAVKFYESSMRALLVGATIRAMATATNRFKVIGGGRDQDQKDGDGTPPTGEPRIELGKLKTKSVYLHEAAYEAGISRLKWYAGTRRYQLSEVLSALFDLAASNIEELDDFMLKYEKARQQNAEQSAS